MLWKECRITLFSTQNRSGGTCFEEQCIIWVKWLVRFQALQLITTWCSVCWRRLCPQLSCETWLSGSLPVENVQSSNYSFQHWPGELTWLSRWPVYCINRFQTDETVFFFTSLGISVQHHIVTFLLVRCVYHSPECVVNKTRQYIVLSWYNFFVFN